MLKRLVAPVTPPDAINRLLMTGDIAWNWGGIPGCRDLFNVAPSASGRWLRLVTEGFLQGAQMDIAISQIPRNFGAKIDLRFDRFELTLFWLIEGFISAFICLRPVFWADFLALAMPICAPYGL